MRPERLSHPGECFRVVDLAGNAKDSALSPLIRPAGTFSRLREKEAVVRPKLESGRNGSAIQLNVTGVEGLAGNRKD